MAEWSTHQTRNPAVPSSSPALASYLLDLFLVIPSSNPRPCLWIAN